MSKSKDRQYNDQGKRINDHLPNTTQKNKDRATRMLQKQG